MRRGLTLIEVVVALAIAGLIALAARAALVAGLDTQERLTAFATRTQGDARFRALVVQAFRHIADAPAVGLPAFVLRDTLVQGDARSHIAEFYSRGLAFPAGTGPVVRVRVGPVADGLAITALGSDGATLLRGVAPGIDGMRIRVRAIGGDEWLEAWPRSLVTPAAVAVEFTRPAASGSTDVLVPLVVATRLEERP